MSSNTDQAALLEAIELQDAFSAKTQFAKFLLKQEVQQEARRLFRECSEKQFCQSQSSLKARREPEGWTYSLASLNLGVEIPLRGGGL